MRNSLSPSIPNIDKSLALTTAVGLGLRLALASLPNTTAYATARQFTTAIILGNEIGRHFIAVKLPPTSAHPILKAAVHPGAYLASCALSYVFKSSAYEWPVGAATAYVLTKHAFDKGIAGSSMPMHLFNGLGAMILALGSYNPYPILSQILGNRIGRQPSLVKIDTCPRRFFFEKICEIQELDETLKNIRTEHRTDVWKRKQVMDAERQENQKKQKEIREETAQNRQRMEQEHLEFEESLKRSAEEIERQFWQEQEEQAERNRKAYEYLYGDRQSPQECPPVYPNDFRQLSDLERLNNYRLNPLCTDAARILFTMQGEEHKADAFASPQEIRSRQRHLSRLVHPDKNPSQRSLAEEAFIRVQKAKNTLMQAAKLTTFNFQP